MGLTASMDVTDLRVEAGQLCSCQILLRNAGTVVDRVLLDVLGDSAGWARVEPSELHLLPGAEATARVAFHPPRTASVRAGAVPFAVRAMSVEDPDGSVIEEGVVHVGEFSDVTLELSPRTSHGRRLGQHRVSVMNRGNAEALLRLAGSDPDDGLEFQFRPDSFVSRPGTSALVSLRVAPRTRFLRGPNRSLPFRVYSLTDAAEPAATDGIMLQRQMMPTWLLPCIAIVGAAAIALSALWVLVFKPQVHSAAVDAVSQQTSQLATNAANASSAAAAANRAASAARSAASAGGAGAAGASGASAGRSPGAGNGADAAPASGSPPAGPPVTSRLAPTVAPGQTGTVTYTFPAGMRLLTVSDLVYQNPAGDSGTMLIEAGNSVLFDTSLNTFRDRPESFLQPLEFTASSPFTVVVSCTNPTVTCTAGVTLSGELHR